MRERVLLMGPPNSGKSYQLIRVYQALLEQGKEMAIIDLEDKLSATMEGLKLSLPRKFYVCLTWEEYVEAINKLNMRENEWIGVDRIDLSWSYVQRWYSQEKYQRELSEKLLESAKQMKKASMFTPMFTQGDWQPVNEAYDSATLKLLYRSRCNIIMTTGIRGADSDNALDVFSSLGVTNRGQKELQHQPHSAFLLFQRKRDRQLHWYITTGKDLPNRLLFEDEEIFDFFLQYVSNYWSPK